MKFKSFDFVVSGGSDPTQWWNNAYTTPLGIYKNELSEEDWDIHKMLTPRLSDLISMSSDSREYSYYPRSSSGSHPDGIHYDGPFTRFPEGKEASRVWFKNIISLIF